MEPPPTLQELVREVGISVDLLNQRCSDEHLKSISLFLDWRNVAPHLGLSERDIEDIKSEERKESERRLAALQRWKKKYSFKATLKSVVEVLLMVGNADDAETLCRLLKSETDGSSAAALSRVGSTMILKSREGDTGADDEGPVYGCGCGHCTFVAFIKSGCPHPTFTKTGLPFLDTSRLSDTEKEHLVGQLSDESEDLIFAFQHLVSSSCASLEKQGVAPAQLAMSLLTLGTLSPVFANPQVPLFHERSRDLQSAPSIKAVFFVIHGYISFFHYNVLEHLISEFGTPEDKAQLESYSAKLDDYCHHRLFECPPLYGHSCKTHHCSISVKLDENLEAYTLKQLKRFWSRFTRHLRLSEYALRLVSVEEGCMRLLFQIPSSSAVHQLFPLSSEQEEALEDEKIIQLVCRDYKFSSKTRSLPTATPTVPLVLSEPSRQETEEGFDIIGALLGAGVPHITQQILCYLDLRSLMTLEAVSTLWRDVIGELQIWKHLVKHQLESSPLWRRLLTFERRGWYKYLGIPLPQQMSNHYRQLHQAASKDIHSLETNWRRGHYTLTKIETGSSATCLQFDDMKIVTGHGDYTIKIWDRSTLQVSKVLEGHKSYVWCLQYSEAMLISGSGDNTVKVWDVQTGQVINKLLHHKGPVRSLKFTTNTLVTSSRDRTAAVWDIKSPTDITLRTVLVDGVFGVFAVDLSETVIISGHGDGTIKVWDTFTGGLVRTLRGHSDINVWRLQLLGSHFISGSADSTIRIWSINTGECVRVLHGHDSGVWCVAMDDKRILSGSLDKTVKVWDLAAALDPGSSSDALCMATLKEHTAEVFALQFNNFQVITSSSDKTMCIYDFLERVPPILRV